MADTNAPSSEERGKIVDPENYGGSNEQEWPIVILGEPGTIPIKLFRSQRQSTQSNDQPGSSRNQGNNDTR